MTIRKANKATSETDPDRLARMARSRDSWVRLKVASNPATTESTLRRLAADPDQGVRGAVAKHARTPPDVLRTLGLETGHTVHDGVAGNPNTPPETLIHLIDTQMPCGSAMGNLLGNEAATVEVLTHYGVERVRWSEQMREGAARSAEAGFSHGQFALAQLGVSAHDRNTLPARLPSSVLTALAVHEEDAVRAAVPGHPNCPPAALEALSADSSPRVRRAVARSPHAPAGVLAALAADAHSDIREAVAQSPSTPPATLAQLATDADTSVREAAWSNPATPEDAQRQALTTLIGEADFLRRHPQEVAQDPSIASDPSFDSAVEQLFWRSHQTHYYAELVGLTPQHPVGRYRLDFALPAQKIGLEIDGLAYHGGQKEFVADRQRQRDLELEGWRILRFAAQEVMVNADDCVRQAATWVRRQAAPTDPHPAPQV
jgi:very-short-patch-repair endonuclease